jgi:hypothetical protein
MAMNWAGDRLVFDATSADMFTVAGFTPGTKEAMELASDAALPAGTSDGRTVVFVRPSEPGLWKMEVGGGSRPAELLSSQALFPIVTTDDRFLFLSTRNGIQSPWIVPLEGGEAKQIVNVFAGVGTLEVSQDGRRMMSHRRASPPELSLRDDAVHTGWPGLRVCGRERQERVDAIVQGWRAASAHAVHRWSVGHGLGIFARRQTPGSRPARRRPTTSSC